MRPAFLRPVLAAFFLCAVATATSRGGEPDDLRDELEAYLNSITTLEARFVQVNDDGSVQTGTGQIKRPHFARFAYDDPPTLLVVRGQRLMLRDGETGEVLEGPADASPASLLLRPRVSLDGDIEVLGIVRDQGHLVARLQLAGEPGAGFVDLVVEENPMRLRRWRVQDAQGLVTRVTLVDAVFGGEIDSGVFEFDEPGERRD